MLTCVARSVSAQPAHAVQWPAEAIIRFAATSTLHDFGGEVPAQPFVLTVASNSWSAEASVLSGTMGTGNGSRDKKMHEMFNTNDYPRIHGKVAAAPIPISAPTNATLRLTIRDQLQDVPVEISRWSETISNVTFHATWKLSLKQFKLKPPSVIGLVRVGDTVQLQADVTARKIQVLTNPPAVRTVPTNKP